MRTTVLVNPRAASGRAPAIWRQAVAATGDFDAEVIQVDAPEAACARLEAALDAGTERVIVVGGDGSVHLAVNALLAAGRGDAVPLGIVPAGTGSDLARTLGLAGDPTESLRRIREDASRRIDVLHLQTADGRSRFVVNVASAGISGLVDEAVNALPRRSEFAYLKATIQALRRYEPVPARVTVDGSVLFEGRLFLLAVANGSTFGRGMRIAPRAVVDDGLAEVVVIPALGALRLLLRMPQLYRGTHLESGLVHYMRGRRIHLESEMLLPPFDLDGETFASAPAEWAIVPGAVRVAG